MIPPDRDGWDCYWDPYTVSIRVRGRQGRRRRRTDRELRGSVRDRGRGLIRGRTCRGLRDGCCWCCRSCRSCPRRCSSGRYLFRWCRNKRRAVKSYGAHGTADDGRAVDISRRASSSLREADDLFRGDPGFSAACVNTHLNVNLTD